MSVMAREDAELIPYSQQNCFRVLHSAVADNIPHMSNDFQLGLRVRLAQLGLSPRAASLEAGLSADTVGKMLKEGAGLPRGNTLTALARVLRMSEQMLLTGKDVAAPAMTEPEGRDLHYADRDVEIRATVAGSHTQGAFQLRDNAIGTTPLPRQLERFKDVYAIIIINDSMSPLHKPGQVRFVTPHERAKIGDTVVVQFERDTELGAEAMLGILERNGAAVHLGKLNPKDTIVIDSADVINVHRIASYEDLAAR